MLLGTGVGKWTEMFSPSGNLIASQSKGQSPVAGEEDTERVMTPEGLTLQEARPELDTMSLPGEHLQWPGFKHQSQETFGTPPHPKYYQK